MQLTNKNLLRQQCYIDGEWIDANSKKTFSIKNPYNAEIIAHVPDCGKDETARAITAAQLAFRHWRSLTAKQRAEYLHAWADLIDKNKEDLSILMSLEQGKPIVEARSEVDYGNAFIKWFAEEGRRIYGDIIPSNMPNQHILVIKQPIGVVAAITPWNFPIAMITRKCAPALASGCTFVLKPAEDTPLSALALAYLASEAGIPAGVFNVLTGSSKIIGAELTSNPIVRKLSFTGSTEVGKLLMQQCSSTVKKLSLELGGNAPFIVFEDADIDAAVKGAVAAKFRNTGQSCVAANRFLIHDNIYDAFKAKLIEAIKPLRVGHGLDEKSNIGPLINEDAIQKVKKFIKDAVDKGASVDLGGNNHALGSLFFEPTVLANVTSNMLVAKQEIFGPVAALFRFHQEDEAIHMANDTEFGLASYFYTRDIYRIWRVAEALEYGMVAINAGFLSTEVAPFGGIKASGMGREGSKYGIDDYVEIKYLCMN
jgi:succinate-semialdehyde dehydrogenase/glutarate-semialdehyde dehydrogenase